MHTHVDLRDRAAAAVSNSLVNPRRRVVPSNDRIGRVGGAEICQQQAFEVAAVFVGAADLLDAGFNFAEHRHADANFDSTGPQFGDPSLVERLMRS